MTTAAILNGAAEHDWRILVVIALSNGVAPWPVGRYTAAGGRYINELEQQSERQRAATDRAVAECPLVTRLSTNCVS